MRKNEKGFTLIELMIVVAIIGILAAIAIPKFAEMLEKSRDGATKGNIGSLKSAISIYYGDQEGVWPIDLTYGTAAIMATNNLVFKAKYMDDIPAVKSTGANKSNTVNQNKGPSGSGAIGKTVHYFAFNAAPAMDTALSGPTAVATGTGYRYESNTGLVWINSTVWDMAGKPYSLFGYE